MRKFILPLYLFLSLIIHCSAQSLIIKDLSGNDITGTVYMVWADSMSSIAQNLTVTNTNDSALTVQARREENTIVSGSINSFCWAGQCYDPNTSIALLNATIPSGQTENSFFANYFPQGNLGVSIITYVFYDITNHADSAFVIIHNNITPAGIQTIDAGSTVSAYPNPGNGLFMLDVSSLNNSGPTPTISCYDVVGKNILSQVATAGGRTILDLRKYPAGIYFVQIQFADKILTKKMVLQK